MSNSQCHETDGSFRICRLDFFGYLNGCVRDVAIYSRAMETEEVFARYKAGK